MSTPLARRVAALEARQAVAAALPDVMAAERQMGLREFVRQGWPVLEPGTPYVHGRVIDAICEHLEAVTDGQIRRLLINVPPGTAKSLLASCFWPAWEWGPRGLAHHRFLSFSYSERLSIRDNRRTRMLVQSEWYQARWPTVLASDQDAKMKFENGARGWRMASSVTGVGTGERADRLIIDDPHAVTDAESPAKMEATLLWWRETLPLRINNPVTSAIVVIMQRVHERDVSGEILAKGLGYEHLCLPMEYEPERSCRTKIGFRDWRKRPGELLFPERYPAQTVEDLKVELGSYAAAAQFQQRPAPRRGGMIPVDKLTVVDEWPREAAQVRRWDFAATEASLRSDPDWTAGVRVAWHKGRAWIVDIQRDRRSPHGVELLVKGTAERDTSDVPVLLEQEPGSSGSMVVDHYRREVLPGFPVFVSKVTGSKVQRANPFAAAVEAGNVMLVRGAWNDAFVDECRSFPAGAHDDQVDAAADGFSWLARRGRQQVEDVPMMPVQVGSGPPRYLQDLGGLSDSSFSWRGWN